MEIVGAVETDVGSYFGLVSSPCLRARPLRTAPFSVTRIRRAVRAGSEFVVDIPPQDAYFLMLYLGDVKHCDIVANGVRTRIAEYRKGSICLVDLTEGASICLFSDLDSLGFHLPRQLFEELVEASSEAASLSLRCRRGEIDPVMRDLGVALLPLFDQSGLRPPAALRHIAIAICAHLLHNYGDVRLRSSLKNSVLSVWQEKAAKEFMIDNFGGDVSVAAVAAATGLSSGHFSHGFKNATGVTPHQWLVRFRVSQAKRLLADRSMSLSMIAAECGFTDQSHFSKVFCREAGMTPSAWRNRWTLN